MTALLTLAESATALRVSVRTLEREIRDGRLAVIRVRTRRLVAREELDRYIAASREVACQSVKSVNAGKYESASAVAVVLSRLSRAAPATPTRKRSALRSSGQTSTLRLVAGRDT